MDLITLGVGAVVGLLVGLILGKCCNMIGIC